MWNLLCTYIDGGFCLLPEKNARKKIEGQVQTLRVPLQFEDVNHSICVRF